MTNLNKPVRRRTIGLHRGRRIMVSLEPGDLLGMREERRRKTYYIPICAAFDLAVKMEVGAQRRAKAEAKKKFK